MELFLTPRELADFLRRSQTVAHGEPLHLVDAERFREGIVDSLVWTAVFGEPEVREAARRTIREAARELQILPASILALYEARGRGEVSGFTVPAVNVRMLAYDTMRAALRAARSLAMTWPGHRFGYAISTPHHSAMNSAVALVDFRSESSSTYSLKPCIAAPLAPKHRLGML